MDRSQQPIFLIGYRGTGKTTVARELAKRLNYHCIDADVEVERQAGKSIAQIFAEDGESVFRDLEATVVEDLCQSTRTVVALGGGAVLRDTNRDAVKAAGPVVWLKASVETIALRLAGDETTASRRPNLTAAGGAAEIAAVLTAREPIYRACATLEVDTEGRLPFEIADSIYEQLRG